MKPPKPRFHMLDVPEPLTNYSDIKVRCGIVLNHALAVLSLREEEDVAAIIPAYRICRDCDIGRPENLPKYWRYWLIEGAEEASNLSEERGEDVAF